MTTAKRYRIAALTSEVESLRIRCDALGLANPVHDPVARERQQIDLHIAQAEMHEAQVALAHAMYGSM